MPEEGFLRRWARVKATAGEAVADPAPPAAPPAAPAVVAVPPAVPTVAPAQPAPTLGDAAQLTSDADFSAFVGAHVGQDVRRLALKKLFADPHFNVLDRLDMYMDDYNKPDPVSAAMLAALDHARGSLRRPEEVQAEIARLRARDAPAEEVDAATDAADAALDAPDGFVDEPQEAAPAASEADLAPLTAEHDRDDISDVVAPTPGRAHNAQAGI